jgi:hypothetical protein
MSNESDLTEISVVNQVLGITICNIVAVFSEFQLLCTVGPLSCSILIWICIESH